MELGRPDCISLVTRAEAYPEMPSYRLYLIGLDGYLIASTSVACPNDTEALMRGAEMLRTFYAAVEVWDGSRKVGHLEPGVSDDNSLKHFWETWCGRKWSVPETRFAFRR
jgi:hypothetical protein